MERYNDVISFIKSRRGDTKQIDLLNEIEEVAWELKDKHPEESIKCKTIIGLARTLKAPLIT